MIRFRLDGAGPVTGFGGFLANGLTVAPQVAIVFTLLQNGPALVGLDQTTPGETLLLSAMALCVLLGVGVCAIRRSFRARTKAPADGPEASSDVGHVLTCTLTALAWVLLVLLPTTTLKAVVPLHAAGGGMAAWAGGFLFTSANPRRVARLLDPRRAGHWELAPTHDVTRFGQDRHAHPGTEIRPLAAIALLGPLLLGIFSIQYPLWLPSADHGALILANFIPITWAAGAYGATLGFRASGSSSPSVLRRLAARFGTTILCAALCMVLATPFLRIGLPYAASFVLPAEPATIVVSVAEKGERHPRQGCRYSVRIMIHADDPASAAWLCEVPADLWDGLKPGDRLTVSGPGNRFGIR